MSTPPTTPPTTTTDPNLAEKIKQMRDASELTKYREARPIVTPVKEYEPEGYALKFVQVITRHGRRTPESRRYPLTLWSCNNMENLITNKDASNRPACTFGQLTVFGTKDLINVGSAYRKLFVDRLKFLDDKFNPSQIFVRSSDRERTINSARSLMHGLYGGSFEDEQEHSPDHNTFLVTPEDRENIYPRSSCARYAFLRAVLKKHPTVLAENKASDLKGFGDRLKGIFEASKGYDSPFYLQSWGSYAGLVNSFDCFRNHGLPLPSGFTDDVVARMYLEAAKEYKSWGLIPDISILGIGRFVNDLSKQLDSKATNQPATKDTKFALYSAHDSTLGAVLVAYKMYDDNKHPETASTLEFLLFEKEKKDNETKQQQQAKESVTQDKFVKIIYNQKVLHPEDCKAYEVDGMCPYDKFLQINKSLIPTNYEEQCKISDEEKKRYKDLAKKTQASDSPLIEGTKEVMPKVYTLGIRREDKNRWERRAPLAPSHIEELVKKGIRVIVQPSTLRNYSNGAYQKAGAIIQEDLRECDTIIAVKEVPSEYLYPGKTYLFFSHTIKAQPYNMPMLDEINKKHIRLIDYERITDEKNRRLVRFGAFAGYAGMIDMLHALGDRLLAKGFSTPFLLENAMDAVRAIGEEISQVGLPDELLPFTFAFTSEGAVAQGALSIFKLLPHKMVTPDEMVDLVKNKKGERGILYGTMVTSEHMVEPIDPEKKFNKKEYYDDPSKYKSIFYEKYAPYISCLINCMYWDAKFPRLITIRQMEHMVETNNSRLLGVADISADINGSLEFLMRTTSIDSPLYIYDPKTQEIHDPTTDQKYMYRDGILFLAVDNLPTEFPKEATQWFGDHLSTFMEAIVRSDPMKPYDKMDDIPAEIKRAVITSHGSITPPFEYIKELRKKREAMIGRILIVGAGYVSLPVISYLTRNPSHMITVADNDIEQTKKALNFEPDMITTIILDVNDQKHLDEIVKKHTIVISLLPDDLNLLVAKSCLRNKRHLITTSYLSDEINALHKQVQEAGLTFVFEMGLDPGIDHLEAARVIADVQKQGGRIRTFVSWCGGLPAPESSDNPLGYKFSWSPRGVLEAVTMDAEYRQDGREIFVPGQEVYKRCQPVDIFPALSLEGVPNRSCLSLAKAYNIEDCNTLFRGTLRYKGFCQVIDAAIEIGLLDEKVHDYLLPEAPSMSWNSAVRQILPTPLTETLTTQEIFRRKLRTRRGYPTKGYDDEKITSILSVFEWLGIFAAAPIAQKGTYIDSFCELLKGKLEFSPSERDLILLHHVFGIEWPGGHHETKTSTLVSYGTKEISAMGLNIGLPVAMAAELLVEGSIKERGVVIPVTEEYYKPILKALHNEGITFIHRSNFDN
eukprot:gene15981-19006_t